MIAVLQWTVSRCPKKNLQYVAKQLSDIRQVHQKGDILVCLPESFACFDAPAKATLAFAKQSQAFINQICELAVQFKLWISAGTIPIAEGEKYYAASLIINHRGEVVARYNKIHLFDVDISDNKKHYRESNTTIAGKDIVVVESPFGKLGLSVCYDIRFAGLFGQLRSLGAELILLPAAFTVPTGKAHWRPLLQARAIENQVYIIASATTGVHDRGRQTYGHSAIVNPWGEVVAELGQQSGHLLYLPDRAKLADIRQSMPVGSHNQFTYEFKHEQ
jgi:nitrilase